MREQGIKVRLTQDLLDEGNPELLSEVVKQMMNGVLRSVLLDVTGKQYSLDLRSDVEFLPAGTVIEWDDDEGEHKYVIEKDSHDVTFRFNPQEIPDA